MDTITIEQQNGFDLQAKVLESYACSGRLQEMVIAEMNTASVTISRVHFGADIESMTLSESVMTNFVAMWQMRMGVVSNDAAVARLIADNERLLRTSEEVARISNERDDLWKARWDALMVENATLRTQESLKVALMQDVCDKACDYCHTDNHGEDGRYTALYGALASLDAWTPDIEEHEAQQAQAVHS